MESAAKMVIQMTTIKMIIFCANSLLCMLTEDVRGAFDVRDSAENNLDYKSSKKTKTKMSIEEQKLGRLSIPEDGIDCCFVS